jgi:outer membrane protein
MKFKVSSLLIVIILFHTIFSFSQESWSLEKCISHAIDNNITIKQQELNTKSNEVNHMQSILNLLPSLSATGTYSAQIGRALDQTTYQFINNQTVRYLNGSISSNLTLFSGFQKINTIKQNQYNLLASLKDLEKLRNDISLNVAAAYLQILFNMELLQVAKNQVGVTQLQVDRTSKLVDAGSLPMGNLLEIQSQQASEELQLITSQNQLDISYLTLSQILELDSVGSFKILVPDFSKIGDEDITTNVNEIFQDALVNLPQIKSSEYKLKSAELGLDIFKGAASPRIFLSGNYGSGYSDTRQQESFISTEAPIGYTKNPDQSIDQIVYTKYQMPVLSSYPFYPQLKDNASTTIAIGASIPIFNGWQIRANISNAKINVLNSKYSYEITKKQLYKDIQQAYADAIAALKKYHSTEKALSSINQSYNYTEQKFEVGLVNTVDYYTAKNQLAKTQSDLLQAKYDYIFKSRILDFYRGKPIKL